MPFDIDRMNHALEPLRVVDAKTLEEIAKALKGSRNRQKQAVGVFLSRINQYRLESSSSDGSSGGTTRHASDSGLRDL